MGIVEGHFSICWFGQAGNGWEDYMVAQPIENTEQTKLVEIERGAKEFF